MGLTCFCLLTACGGSDLTSNSNSSSAKKVTILATITGEGQKKIEQSLQPFTEKTGIAISYEGTDAFTTLLPVRVASGNPPDIALFPQPGLMADFAKAGDLIPLDTVIDASELNQAYSQTWQQLGSVHDKLYGLWYRASVKSLVWYNPKAFAQNGYKVPQTWEELIALSDQIVAEGKTPWCIGIESGGASGWVGTDWIEDIVLRMAGTSVYDQWVSHDIPFTHPTIKSAFAKFGEIVLNQKYVRGGTVGAISIPFGDAATPLFDDPPGCYLHRQASFITEFFPKRVVPGEDVDFFVLPPINPEFKTPILVSGVVFALFKDTPEARALMAYLATSEPHEILSGLGDSVSPQQQVNLEVYPDEITRRQAELLLNAEIIRFDGSDLMPGAVGTGTFWSGIVDYIGGTDLDQVLQNIDASWE